MQNKFTWLSLLVSILIPFVYELRDWRAAKSHPSTTARATHLLLRAQWVRALSRHHGSEIVAVQALRNSLMSATINASTAALALMGTISLLGSHGGLEQALTVNTALRAALVLTLFATYVCSALSLRFYHHAGFVMSMPVGSAERESHLELAVTYVQRGGILYSWSLRFFLYSAPIVLGLIQPLAMPLAALGLVLVLIQFDRAPKPVKGVAAAQGE
jgi:hypothetical protein